MRSIGRSARRRTSSATSICGARSRRQRYSFSSVFRRMCGHTLHAQRLVLGRRGDERLARRLLRHLVQDAGLGRDDERRARGWSSRTAMSADVEPMKCGVAQDGLLALGVGDDLGVGVLDLQLEELLLAERLVDDAGALPQHHVGPVRLLLHEARRGACRARRRSSGRSGNAFTIFTAFDDVQMTSDSAFTSAEQLM